jgi:hypothetical protein
MSKRMVAPHVAIACLAGLVGLVAYGLNGMGCFQAKELFGSACGLLDGHTVFLQASLPVAAIFYVVWGVILLHERANKRA